MPGRTYARVKLGTLKTLKLAGLSGPEKIVYLAIYLSQKSSYEGLFDCPFMIVVDDVGLSAEEIRDALNELVAKGLIEYCFETEWVRIVGLNRSINRPGNPSTAIKRIEDLSECECPNIGMFCRAFAELAVKIIELSANWNDKDKNYQSMRRLLTEQIRRFHFNYGIEFDIPLKEELDRYAKSVRRDTSIILPALDCETFDRAEPIGGHRVDTEENGDSRAQEQNRIETDCDESIDDDFDDLTKPDNQQSTKARSYFPSDETKNSKLGRSS